ncbi:MAG: prolipoprotein diacylglyceryl transferase [Actinobacteria bacterium]|nr:prolipoprotein diacylglyceryl transferase [Actinomycetota bacterium]
MHLPFSIPSPSHGVLQLGPLPLRGYALMIIAGIAVAIWLGDKRWVARGGKSGQVSEVAMWAVPFGVLGGRIYHVLTDWSAYFGSGGRGFAATFKIWEGGLGIWGAIALGAFGAYIGCARQGMKLAPFADAIAPGLVFAQAIGRWGNWFNQELFGRPTSLPWGLQIDRAYRPLDYINYPTFHPTFLYESIACAALGFFLLWADRKFVFGYGRLFALYLAIYCAARGVIETIRVDDAMHVLGIRFNVFTAIFVGIGALIYYVRSVERFPGQEIIQDGRVVGARSDEEVRELRATPQEEPQTPTEPVVESDNIGQGKQNNVQPTGPRRGRRVAPKE